MIDIDSFDQSAEIDDTLVSFIDLSWFLPISSIHIGKNICPSVNQKSKTGFMQTVNLLTIVVYQTINTIKKSLKNLISLLKLRLKSSSDG